MQAISALFDSITLVGFLAAAVVMASTSASDDGTLGHRAKWFAVGALMVYVLGAAGDLLEQFANIDPVGQYEELTAILFAPFILYSLQLTYTRQQLRDLRASQVAANASRDMMLSLVDTAPAGILLLNEVGRITFANQTARDLLDLTEEPGTGEIVQPAWKVFDPTGHAHPDFRAITADRRMLEKRVRVVWPDGRWSLELAMSTSPLNGGSGTVAAFPVPARR